MLPSRLQGQDQTGELSLDSLHSNHSFWRRHTRLLPVVYSSSPTQARDNKQTPLSSLSVPIPSSTIHTALPRFCLYKPAPITSPCSVVHHDSRWPTSTVPSTLGRTSTSTATGASTTPLLSLLLRTSDLLHRSPSSGIPDNARHLALLSLLSKPLRRLYGSY